MRIDTEKVIQAISTIPLMHFIWSRYRGTYDY